MHIFLSVDDQNYWEFRKVTLNLFLNFEIRVPSDTHERRDMRARKPKVRRSAGGQRNFPRTGGRKSAKRIYTQSDIPHGQASGRSAIANEFHSVSARAQFAYAPGFSYRNYSNLAAAASAPRALSEHILIRADLLSPPQRVMRADTQVAVRSRTYININS